MREEWFYYIYVGKPNTNFTMKNAILRLYCSLPLSNAGVTLIWSQFIGPILKEDLRQSSWCSRQSVFCSRPSVEVNIIKLLFDFASCDTNLNWRPRLPAWISQRWGFLSSIPTQNSLLWKSKGNVLLSKEETFLKQNLVFFRLLNFEVFNQLFPIIQWANTGAHLC